MSQNTLGKYLNREHKMREIDNDKERPICSMVFITKETMQVHFRESHMNPIDFKKKSTTVRFDNRRSKKNCN